MHGGVTKALSGGKKTRKERENREVSAYFKFEIQRLHQSIGRKSGETMKKKKTRQGYCYSDFSSAVPKREIEAFR